MSYHSSILPSVFVTEAPCVLITKNEKQPIRRVGGDGFEGPTFLPPSLGTNARIGA